MDSHHQRIYGISIFIPSFSDEIPSRLNKVWLKMSSRSYFIIRKSKLCFILQNIKASYYVNFSKTFFWVHSENRANGRYCDEKDRLNFHPDFLWCLIRAIQNSSDIILFFMFQFNLALLSLGFCVVSNTIGTKSKGLFWWFVVKKLVDVGRKICGRFFFHEFAHKDRTNERKIILILESGVNSTPSLFYLYWRDVIGRMMEAKRLSKR